jgi:hypothetical protein
MLVVTLGTHASASTWVFNVVRALFAAARRGAISFTGTTAAEILEQMPAGARDVIVKVHKMDQPLLRLLSLADAKVIVTDRDPRDSVVSQQERFAAPVRHTVCELSGALASIAMLDRGARHLFLHYEEGFASDRATIDRIADHCGIAIDASARDAIFAELQPDAIKNHLGGWLSRLNVLGASPEANPVTQWHPGHIGDRQIGKWQHRLDARAQSMVADFLLPLAQPDAWRHEPLTWPSEAFLFHDDRSPVESESLELDGSERVLVHGPYFNLPTGFWEIEPILQPAFETGPLSVKLDLYINKPGRGLMALKTMNFAGAFYEPVVLELEHVDHSEPIELRITSIGDGHRGRLLFGGARLRWLGEIGASPAARHRTLPGPSPLSQFR